MKTSDASNDGGSTSYDNAPATVNTAIGEGKEEDGVDRIDIVHRSNFFSSFFHIAIATRQLGDLEYLAYFLQEFYFARPELYVLNGRDYAQHFEEHLSKDALKPLGVHNTQAFGEGDFYATKATLEASI